MLDYHHQGQIITSTKFQQTPNFNLLLISALILTDLNYHSGRLDIGTVADQKLGNKQKYLPFAFIISKLLISLTRI
jgi:hypothetical protein